MRCAAYHSLELEVTRPLAIEKDGWDKMKPLAADNHPPGMREPECSWANATTAMISSI